jgi:hypothetical protein
MASINASFAPRVSNHSTGPDASVTTLSAATPADSVLRDLAVKEMSALCVDELGRRDQEWTHTVESVKKTLAALERTCDVALDKFESGSQPSAAVARVVEKLVAAAGAEAESAAQRTRAEAQVEIDRLEAFVDRTEADLAEERRTLKLVREELEQERIARQNAEAAQEKAQSVHHLVVSDLASQLQSAHAELKSERAEVAGLKQQLETERGERVKLVAALQTVQRAVLLADPAGAAPAPEPVPNPAAAAPTTSRSDASTTHKVDAAPDSRPLKLVPNSRTADVDSHPELLEYVKQLLGEMETIYWADLRSEGNAADVVDRLAANLRYARDLFTRRLAAYDVRESSLFEQQISLLMDVKPETSFARHLAIAAYEDSPAPKTGPQARAEAS